MSVLVGKEPPLYFATSCAKHILFNFIMYTVDILTYSAYVRGTKGHRHDLIYETLGMHEQRIYVIIKSENNRLHIFKVSLQKHIFQLNGGA